MRLIGAIFAAWLCAAQGSAFAQTFTASPNSSFVLDFDSEDGNFSLWRLNDLSGLTALRARTTFARKGTDARWAPSFSIAVGNDNATARLSVLAAPNSGPLIVETSLVQGRTRDQRETFVLTPTFEEPFDLHVNWTPDGVVTFRIYSRAAQAVNGYEQHQVRLGVPPTALSISGSTSEVQFDPLQLGTTSP